MVRLGAMPPPLANRQSSRYHKRSSTASALNTEAAMISEDLLAILLCPETRQTLRVAEGPLIERLNAAVRAGTLTNRVGHQVETPLDGGLIREDNQWLYPIVDDIPIMLADEAVSLEGYELPPGTTAGENGRV